MSGVPSIKKMDFSCREVDTEYYSWPWMKKSFNFIVPKTILLVWVRSMISGPFLFNPWAAAMVSHFTFALLASRIIMIFTSATSAFHLWLQLQLLFPSTPHFIDLHNTVCCRTTACFKSDVQKIYLISIKVFLDTGSIILLRLIMQGQYNFFLS